MKKKTLPVLTSSTRRDFSSGERKGRKAQTSSVTCDNIFSGLVNIWEFFINIFSGLVKIRNSFFLTFCQVRSSDKNCKIETWWRLRRWALKVVIWSSSSSTIMPKEHQGQAKAGILIVCFYVCLFVYRLGFVCCITLQFLHHILCLPFYLCIFIWFIQNIYG